MAMAPADLNFIGDIHKCSGEALRWLPIDYKVSVKEDQAHHHEFRFASCSNRV
jgi:hypothetical protein